MGMLGKASVKRSDFRQRLLAEKDIIQLKPTQKIIFSLSSGTCFDKKNKKKVLLIMLPYLTSAGEIFKLNCQFMFYFWLDLCNSKRVELKWRNLLFLNHENMASLLFKLKMNSDILKASINFSWICIIFLNCRYGLGWRGGKWHANRQFRKEQMKLLGQIKPRGWQLFGRIKPKGWQFQSLRRRITRSREPETAAKTPEKMLKDASTHIILE